MTPKGGNQSVVVAAKQQIVIGPLPAPETLAGYERVLPGAAERIMVMAEREQLFRHGHEKQKAQDSETGERRVTRLYFFGQLSGLIITVMGIYFGYALIGQGKDIAGFATVLTTLGAICGIFVWGRRNRQPPAPPPTPS